MKNWLDEWFAVKREDFYWRDRKMGKMYKQAMKHTFYHSRFILVYWVLSNTDKLILQVLDYNHINDCTHHHRMVFTMFIVVGTKPYIFTYTKGFISINLVTSSVLWKDR